MSYSFSVRAATVALALVAVSEKLDAMVKGQPDHEIDVSLVKTTAKAFADLLPAPREGFEVEINVSGAVYVTEHGLHAVHHSIGAGFTPNP